MGLEQIRLVVELDGRHGGAHDHWVVLRSKTTGGSAHSDPNVRRCDKDLSLRISIILENVGGIALADIDGLTSVQIETLVFATVEMVELAANQSLGSVVISFCDRRFRLGL